MEPTPQESYDESGQSNPNPPEQSQSSEPQQPQALIPRPEGGDWNRPRSVLTSIGLEGFVQQKRVQERAYPQTPQFPPVSFLSNCPQAQRMSIWQWALPPSTEGGQACPNL